MSKLKVKKSIIKRFNVSKNGKLVHKSPMMSHLLSKKTSRRKQRNTRRVALSSSSFASIVRYI